MLFTGADLRVLHLHPTRRCNLQCLHCYSSSGPAEDDVLEIGVAAAAVTSAARLGYTMLSLSGGEPLMYPGVWLLMREARRAGMLVAIVTNGIGISGSVAERLREYADVVAVSLDGRPARHDYLRNHPRAFAAMEKGLTHLRDAGVRFNLLFSLDASSLGDLEWAASYAVDRGASALQLHPVERIGRAMALPPEQAPAEETALKAWLIVRRLQEIWGSRLRIETDVADLAAFARWESCDVDPALASADSDSLSRIVSPLIVEPEVVPLRYGFSRAFTIGNLHDATLDDLAAAWVANRAQAFLAVGRDALVRAARQQCPFGNPYQIIADAAASHVCVRRSVSARALPSEPSSRSLSSSRP